MMSSKEYHEGMDKDRVTQAGQRWTVTIQASMTTTGYMGGGIETFTAEQIEGMVRNVLNHSLAVEVPPTTTVTLSDVTVEES